MSGITVSERVDGVLVQLKGIIPLIKDLFQEEVNQSDSTVQNMLGYFDFGVQAFMVMVVFTEKVSQLLFDETGSPLSGAEKRDLAVRLLDEAIDLGAYDAFDSIVFDGIISFVVKKLNLDLDKSWVKVDALFDDLYETYGEDVKRIFDGLHEVVDGIEDVVEGDK